MAEWAPPIESVNYHIWRTCNMRCRFCFATYDSVLPVEFRRGLALREASELIRLLAASGFKKITFAGGEPTLCPWLSEVIAVAKNAGLITCLVSNGSRLTSDLVETLPPHLDWLTISIDSGCQAVNDAHGRMVAGERSLDVDDLIASMQRLRDQGVRLKVNTVVTRFNSREILLPVIERIKPERWKVMRVLHIDGENDRYFERLSVPLEDFENYVRINHPVPPGTALAIEDNDDMINTYVIVDPAGRFIDNSDGRYRASDRILEIGVKRALSMVPLNRYMFVRRGGVYDW